MRLRERCSLQRPTKLGEQSLYKCPSWPEKMLKKMYAQSMNFVMDMPQELFMEKDTNADTRWKQ